MKNYKYWLVVFFLIFIFVDFSRRFFGETKIPLLLLDVSLIVTYAAFFSTHSLRSIEFNKIIMIVLATFAAMVILQVANPIYADIPTRLAGLRTYLLAVPLLWVGFYYFAENATADLEKMTDLLCVVALLVASYAVVQFVVDASSYSSLVSALLLPMEHAEHSFGATPQKMVSGPFASAWRYGMFMLGLYVTIFGYSARRAPLQLGLFCLFLVGLWLGGNRTIITLFIIINAIALFVFFRRGLLTLAYVLLFASVVYLLGTSLGVISGEYAVSPTTSNLLTRADYFVEAPSEYLQRVSDMFPIAHLRFDSPDVWLGNGIGSLGQEAAVSGSSDQWRLITHYFGGNYAIGIADAGFTKVVIDTGLIGALIFFSFILIVDLLSITTVIQGARNKDLYAFSISLFPILWTISFLKGHPTIADLGVSSMFYLSVAFVLWKTTKQQGPMVRREFRVSL